MLGTVPDYSASRKRRACIDSLLSLLEVMPSFADVLCSCCCIVSIIFIGISVVACIILVIGPWLYKGGFLVLREGYSLNIDAQ